ncbi:putative polysaccharide biosynthesis protein [Agrilactobacillus fermenti]|uniref:putative polysaccharide biosynthesis protein n=1 Tax=Agrilactobacillus fermenti TaxID=2586909 RepID=UPI001E3A54BB|nr:polysaccharide biosynthesis protein [Agrilactobacillus fermenti]MCD2257143.1 polysaccharide biosynthesis protein [Agrilactobacillus fermenti]
MANSPEKISAQETAHTEDKPVQSSKSSLLKGSAWMTAGSIFSRVLGAIYIIPWTTWMGAHSSSANAIYSKGYNIYSIFLVISAAGIPGAISKQVAHYNSLNEYALGQRLFKQGMKIMALFGFVAALVMFFGAPILSMDFGTFKVDQRTVPLFRSLSFALLLIPMMSITRGFFQGYNEMAPSALSQFFEQLGRVAYMLLLTYLIMRVGSGNYVSAVTQSTFAAFIGAITGIGILFWYYLKRKPNLDELAANSANEINISTGQIIREIIHQAIPFIILDSGTTFFQVIDQYTFPPMMRDFVNASQNTIDAMFAIFNFNANKLVMITVSLATALSLTVVPLLSGAHARKDIKGIQTQINDAVELFMFVMVPASFGMAALAHPLYVLFYNSGDLQSWAIPLGTVVLQFYSYLAIFLGLFMVLASVLQGLYMNRKAMLYLGFGVITKIILQYPMIYFFRVFGPLVATLAGMTVACGFMFWALYRIYGFNLNRLLRRIFGIVIFATMMMIVVWLVVKGLYLFINPYSRFMTVIPLAFGVLVGIVIYGYLTLKFHLADRILGSRVAGIRRRLNIK